MKDLPLSIDAMLKSLVCGKIKLPHMTKTIYNPTCLRYCSDLCGVRCRGLCNKDHTGCSRGELSSTFSKCHSADIDRVMLDFISYESNDVETFGKGKPYSRMEKVATKYSFNEFMVALKKEFAVYGEHTISYWFLRATKIEAFAPSQSRSSVATITSDFGEAIQIVAKHETSDQFYHRPEVYILILFFFFS